MITPDFNPPVALLDIAGLLDDQFLDVASLSVGERLDDVLAKRGLILLECQDVIGLLGDYLIAMIDAGGCSLVRSARGSSSAAKCSPSPCTSVVSTSVGSSHSGPRPQAYQPRQPE
jgi:hypothetical protein